MVQIRYAKFNDYNAVLEFYPAMDEDKWERLTGDKQVVFVFDGGELAGFLKYDFSADNVPFIKKLCILDKYQRSGLGTGLMKFWECEMADRGYKRLMLSLNKDSMAESFYLKLGYKVNDSSEYVLNHNEIILDKQIEKGYQSCCSNG